MTLQTTTDERYKLQVHAEPEQAEFFKALSAEAGVPMGLALRIVNEMLILTVGAAKESAVVDPDTTASALELYVALTFRSLGLVTDDEFERFIHVCEWTPKEHVEKRLKIIADLANERLETLRPIWEQSREQFFAEKRKAELGLTEKAKA